MREEEGDAAGADDVKAKSVRRVERENGRGRSGGNRERRDWKGVETVEHVIPCTWSRESVVTQEVDIDDPSNFLVSLDTIRDLVVPGKECRCCCCCVCVCVCVCERERRGLVFSIRVYRQGPVCNAIVNGSRGGPIAYRNIVQV